MSREVDERVVHIEFDNKAFESAVDKTLVTLRELDTSIRMENAAKGFGKIEKAANSMDFSAANDGIATLENNFSTLQIIGITAIQNLTNSVMNFGKKIINGAFSSLVQGGINRAFNIEQARFTIEGLGKDFVKLKEDINYAVSGTAYGFDEAAKAASMMAASNVKAGDEMKSALRGISGMAAMTGSSYSNIADIFGTVAGQQRILSQQLNQFASRGINAAAILTDFLNKKTNKSLKEAAIQAGLAGSKAKDVALFAKSAKLTEKNVRTLVSGSAIDFKTFAKAIDETFGKHATEANKTFTGAMSNIKASLARMGEAFVHPLMETNEKDVLILNTVKDYDKALLNVARDSKLAYENGVNARTELNSAIKQSKNLAKFSDEQIKSLVDGNESNFIKSLKKQKKYSKLSADELKKIYDNSQKSLTDILSKTPDYANKTSKEIKAILKNEQQEFVSRAKELPKYANLSNKELVALYKTYSGFQYNFVSVLQAFKRMLGVVESSVNNSSFLAKFKEIVSDVSEVLSLLFNAIAASFSSVKDVKEAAISVFDGEKEKIIKATDLWKKFQKAVGLGDEEFNNLKDTLKGVKDFFLIFVHLGDGIVKALMPGSNGLKSFGSALLSVTGYLGRFISRIEDAIADTKIFEAIGKTVGYAVSGLGNIVTKVSKKIQKATSNFSILNLIGDSIQATFNAIIKILGGSKGVITSLFDGIVKVMQTGFDILEKSLKGVSFKQITSLSKAIYALRRGLASYSTITPAIVGLIEAVTDKLEDTQKKIRANDLKKIAMSLLIFAAALALMASIDSDKLGGALAAMGTLMAELYFFLKNLAGITGKIDGKKFIKNLTFMSALVPLATAIAILSIAVKNMGGLNAEQLANGLVGIATVMGSLVAFMKLTKDIKMSFSSMTSLIVFSAALVIISKVVKNLGELDVDQLANGLTGLGSILLELAGFMELTKLITSGDKGISGGDLIKDFAGILILAIAIKNFSKSVVSLGNLNEEQLVKGLAGLGGILLAIAGFMQLLKMATTKAEGFSSWDIVKDSVAIFIIAEAVKRLAGSLILLSGLNGEQVGHALMSVGGALGIIVAAIRLMPDAASTLASAAGLLVISAAISILSEALYKLGGMTENEVGNSLSILAASLIMLAASMWAMKDAVAGAAAAILMSVALGMLAPVLMNLGQMSLKEVASALIVLAGAFTIIGIAAEIINPFLLAALGFAIAEIGAACLMTGAGVLFLAEGLNHLSESIPNIDGAVNNAIDGLKAFIVKFNMLIPDLIGIGMKAVLEFLKGVKKNFPKIIETAADIVVSFMKGLAKKAPELVDAAFEMISSFSNALNDAVKKYAKLIGDGAKFLSVETFKTISDSLIELAAAAFILSKINPVAAIKGVLAFAVFVNGLAALLAELGALSKIPGLQNFVESGGKLLGAIGNGIGEMVGGFVGGIGEGITNAMPTMATNLSNFMTNLQPFIEGANNIQPQLADSVKSIADAILALSIAEVGNAVSEFLSWNPFSSSTNGFSDFIDVFIDFAQKAAEIDGDSIEHVNVVCKAVKALAEASAAIPNSGGVVGWWNGENDLGDFAEQLTPFIDAFSKLAGEARKITKDDFEKIKLVGEAAKVLIETSDTIPNSGGVAGWWFGDNTLGDFAEQLIPFGESFSKLTSSISDISEDSINKAAIVGKAAKELALAAAAMPTEEVGWFKTKTPLGLDQFAEQLGPFVEKFKTILPSVEKMNLKSINKIFKIASSIAKLGSVSLNSDGIRNFKLLSEHLPDLGKNIASYADSVKDINAEILLSVNKTLPSLFKSFANIETGMGTRLSEVSSQLTSLGENLKAYASSVSEINAEDLSSTTKAITSSFKSLSKSISSKGNTKGFKSAGKNATDDIVSGFSSKSLAKGLNSAISSALKSVKTDAFTKKGETMAKAFAKAISGYDASKAGKSLGDSAAKGTKVDASKAGSNLASGFTGGIATQSHLNAAYSAGYTLGDRAYQGIKKALDEHSPSKKAEQAGKYAGEGLVIGLKEWTKKVEKAGENVGSSVITALNRTFNTKSGILDGIDTTPVIRPVLDLSNVKMGASQISHMFNNRYALGVAGGLAGNVSGSKPVSIVNNITVDGAEDPTAWVDAFTQELEVQVRMG